jgi:hypothetical protein
MTWAPSTSAGQKYWIGIASSADGTKLAATPEGDSSLAHDYIYTSTDGGANWTPQTDAGARFWEGIASSADGSKLLAGDVSNTPAGYVYTATLSPTTTRLRVALCMALTLRMARRRQNLTIFPPALSVLTFHRSPAIPPITSPHTQPTAI